jgi:DNA-binding LacI/PurR family transcriptional regulator
MEKIDRVERLRKAIDDSGYKKNALAEKVGYKKISIYRLFVKDENGNYRNSNFSNSFMTALERELKITN